MQHPFWDPLDTLSAEGLKVDQACDRDYSRSPCDMTYEVHS